MKTARLLLAVLAVACLFTGCSSGPMNERQFTRAYLDSLEKYNPQVEFRIEGPLEIVGSSGEGEEGIRHYLDNAYREYQAAPDSLSSIVRRYLASSTVLYQERAELQKDHIVPVVRGFDFLEGMPQEMQEKLVYEPYNDDLVIYYAEDTETGISYLNKETLQEAGISADTLRNLAVRNLEDLLTEIQRYGDENYFGLAAGGNYESSLILLEHLWEGNTFPGEGSFTLIVPNRDVVVATRNSDPESITFLREMARKNYGEGSYSVSPHLFRWNGKRFERYE